MGLDQRQVSGKGTGKGEVEAEGADLGRVGKEGRRGAVRMDLARVDDDDAVGASGFFRGLGDEYCCDAMFGAQPLEQFGYLLSFTRIEQGR